MILLKRSSITLAVFLLLYLVGNTAGGKFKPYIIPNMVVCLDEILQVYLGKVDFFSL